MPERYIPLVTPPPAQDSPALWFAFQRGSILVSNQESAALPCCCTLEEHGVAAVRSHYLGLLDDQHCYAAEIDDAHPLPAGWAPLGLRDLFGMVDSTLAALSGRALQIIDWERNHQYCSRCGTPMQPRTDERARACPACRFTSYPPVSPAVMVLITRGRELLLARKAVWPAGRYSAIAGFVEPGEMLEDTVARDKYYLHNDPDHYDCDRQNADAHLRALLLGHSLTMQITGGELVLGQWQRVMMGELDGPRTRTVRAQVWGVAG